MAVPRSGRFGDFVAAFNLLLDRAPQEAEILREGGRLLSGLVGEDNWLPTAFGRSDPDRYSQYLLHLDPRDRYSVVSLVSGPGQSTPVHDHTVWGLVGVLRGAEVSQRYTVMPGALIPDGPARRLEPGRVEAVSPRVGDIHRVSNALEDQVSVSIHVYGADIGRVTRHRFDEAGRTQTFITGYAEPIRSPA